MAKQKPKKSQNVSAPQAVRTTPQYKTPKTAASSAMPHWLSGWMPLALILGVTFVVFIRGSQFEFVNWDDDINIMKNKFIFGFTADNVKNIFTHSVMGGYNPLTILSFAIERALFGDAAMPMVTHVTNVLLHLVCVFLVYRLVLAMGMSAWSALVVGLLFGIHPMRVESVSWATERKDVLFAAFYFGALLQYVKYIQSEQKSLTNKHLIWTLVLFGLSLFSKVQAVSLPLSMLALDYYFNRSWKLNVLIEKAPFFLGSLAYGALNVVMLKNAKTLDDTILNYSFFERLLVGFYSYATYVGKLIYPWIMSPIYPYPYPVPASFYGAPIILIASVVGIWHAFKKGWTRVVFGWVFFFVNFIFVSQIVGAGQGFLADRFTYVPYFGFFVIIAALTEGVFTAEKKEKDVSAVAKFGFAAYALVMTILCWNQVMIWQNSQNLWTKALEYDKKSTTAWLNRGLYFRDQENYDQTLNDITMAIQIKPSANAYNSRAKTYFDMGDDQRAISDATMGIKLDPKLAELWSNRGAAYGRLNRLDSALHDFSKAIELDSTNANVLANRGGALGVIGRKEEAIADLSRALAIDPNHLNARINRLLTYRELGRIELALGDADAYLAVSQDNENIWIDRALMKRALKRFGEAIPDFERAIQINSSNPAYYIERARTYRLLGNTTSMQADIETAKKLGMPNADQLVANFAERTN
jgi:tetratricopeptide (TPR) repeat protein